MAKTPVLEIVRAEIVRLQETYPELPAPPEAYYATRYEGWFAEARKRFEMQSFNRTQAERAEILKRVAEINGLFLTIGRQEGEKQTFEMEQRIRSKNLTVQEMEVDNKIEDLKFERVEKLKERFNPRPVTPPPSKPPNLVDEITAQLEKAVRTELGIREVFGRYRKRSPHLSDWLNEWEARVIWDLKERKWS